MNADATPSQADWGRTVETAACERWDLSLVADEPEAPWWHDAEATRPIDGSPFGTIAAGTPIDAKAARYRIDNGSPRRGRWWLRQSSHEKLVAEDGEYALAVYSPESGVLAMRLVPAWWVDEEVTRWSPSGSRHRSDRSAQIPWSRVFASEEVEA